MIYLRAALLFLSLLGYTFMLKQKFTLRVEFAPAVVCALISSILFAAGILNCFQVAVPAVWLGGAISLVWCAKPFFSSRGKLRNIAVLTVWLLILSYFAFLLRGAHFTHYDNFSHWATVVKDMLLTGRMPNFLDDLILFQAYPLGSSLFIYYVCRIIGTTDACYLFGQVLLLISFILPLAAYVQKKSLLSLLLVPFSLYALTANISIYDLLVDTVMPLAGVALFAMLALEKDRAPTAKTMWAALPLYLFLVNVKNSGIFFVLVCWCFFLFKYRGVWNKSSLRNFVLIDAVLPLGAMFLWKQHVSLVFVRGDVSKHALSLANYKENFTDKSLQNILEIGRLMLGQFFSPQNAWAITLVLLAAILLAVLAVKMACKKPLAGAVLGVVGICGTFGLYMLSLYAMYIFSMPSFEAMLLAGFERYVKTVLIFLFGLTVIFVLTQLENASSKWCVPILLVAVLPLFQCRTALPELFLKQNYETTDRYKFEMLLRQHDVEPGHSYLLYQSGDDAGYLYYLSRYELWSTNVSVRIGKDVEQAKSELGTHDYLIVWEQDEFIQAYLEENGLGQYISNNPVVVNLNGI